MNKSNTPRTNKFYASFADGECITNQDESLALCESRESVLTAARAEISHMVSANGNMHLEIFIARHQRDRLAEVLEKAKPIVSRYPSGWDFSHDELDAADKEIDEALQSLTTNDQVDATAHD
jgi:hypothetical protein